MISLLSRLNPPPALLLHQLSRDGPLWWPWDLPGAEKGELGSRVLREASPPPVCFGEGGKERLGSHQL